MVTVEPCSQDGVQEDVSNDQKVQSESEVMDILGNGQLVKKVLKRGLGKDSRPNHGDSVVISYKGWLEDGTLVEDVEKLNFVIGDGECIHAFDVAIPLAELKEEFELECAPRFAYGVKGRLPEIPPNSKLTYRVTLDECGDPPNYESMSLKERFELADKKRERGNFYFHRDDFQHSLTCYTKALEILLKKSSNPTAKVKEENGMPDDASTKELEVKLRNNIGATQLKLGAFRAAVKSCDDVIQLEPNNRKALNRKGQAYFNAGEFPDAIKAFEECLRYHPDSKFSQEMLAKARHLWGSQRERQARILSRAFNKKNKLTSKPPTFVDKLKGFWRRHKLALSAGTLAGLSVIIAGVLMATGAQHN